MFAWNCCRTCLEVESLYPIFLHSSHHEKYTNAISTAAGIKIQLNDTLPQNMCSSCISFINASIKFRRKCAQSHATLLSRLENQTIDIKVETNYRTVKIEDTSIDIIVSDEEFGDYEDNIPLDTFQKVQCNNVINEIGDNQNQTVDIKSILNINAQIEDDIYIKNSISKQKTRRKVRKKENKADRVRDKKERVKEEIECEYCHKILTSKLSLRNHYKIHTGFDVVCEHCGKKFITRRLLLMHCRAKHGYEKTDKCSYCDYRGSNAEQVKIHERLHTGEKPYVCNDCSAGFHRKSSYLQHVAIHLPDKNVQCDQCPARFKSVTLMRIHKNRHRAPQYTFKCRVCDNTFARRRNVVRHLERIHGLPPEHENIVKLKIS